VSRGRGGREEVKPSPIGNIWHRSWKRLAGEALRRPIVRAAAWSRMREIRESGQLQGLEGERGDGQGASISFCQSPWRAWIFRGLWASCRTEEFGVSDFVVLRQGDSLHRQEFHRIKLAIDLFRIHPVQRRAGELDRSAFLFGFGTKGKGREGVSGESERGDLLQISQGSSPHHTASHFCRPPLTSEIVSILVPRGY
jgi:hypothetical protein